MKTEEVSEILNSRQEGLEVVLTGRGVPERIIEMADLVSEIKSIKHPYDKGVRGRKGIEY
ncbi:MAG: Cob(I)yrinic acid a,c-diamide adenosyltransferase [candidate division WS2 bacterium]|uniref:Cob(I)yrinic acid a,c-diamide adenosyltransferase n=1 Tax=Psychracetigena formicireducens TaxID=2986056 RepID=A0A9E2BEU0_PSYF1|nr:Cob(I)yrinic acid a,c-diamide adenosyltransferase [Candidatus Psychracetigena formicireducens]MBT9144182.1 Cob(I)yrinic acid a,c-diamide adenosyltransferase [Candidatus Psychracetigena formicireducens]MBT9149996.1 Cob(I)yrinic acid a,c-diamide adenosyltransferase [Candidatus Psychracetigena formicireducens]